jgi:hypothetical protein
MTTIIATCDVTCAASVWDGNGPPGPPHPMGEQSRFKNVRLMDDSAVGPLRMSAKARAHPLKLAAPICYAVALLFVRLR